MGSPSESNLPGLLAQLAFVVAVAVGSAGCGGAREAFVGTRVEDNCISQWPLCDKIGGCLLGDTSYVSGRFPGTRKVGTHVFEPSTVTVSFFLEEVGSSGEETTINFFEDRCRSRIRVAVSGRSLLGEFDKAGVVKRSAELSGVGDHLIEFTSDASSRYLMKLDVVPVRLKSQMNNP